MMKFYKGLLWAALFSIPTLAVLYFALLGAKTVYHFIMGVM
jgi:hypothetical protein